MPKEGFPRKGSKEGWASAFGSVPSNGIIVVVVAAAAAAAAALSSSTSLSLCVSLARFAYRCVDCLSNGPRSSREAAKLVAGSRVFPKG
ncbi:hypothetical protein JMJ77_0004324 [Colletotrichum scovillei]|uniref:Uncharacterized protein n=1 Tax=Colletotrichum scovillei TaxID=1209932 RepID=A0A9P7QZ44_9PEZI|nr:hypothetical protein JMJ77_0004324 [Colletotrichum scovillei]KAG7049578.1 hypothetical protein JMJ78_0013559 [Colletotrichum scovillei]KAG7064318.1 hypothetical protein JMJ76_0007363 [Colletotrichum scovillei]